VDNGVELLTTKVWSGHAGLRENALPCSSLTRIEQAGTNENANSMVCRFFLKGADV
jgi:IS30 family transposase